MFCSSCGKQINDNAVVCPFCGAPVEENQNFAQPQAPQAPYAPQMPQVQRPQYRPLPFSGLELATAIVLYVASFLLLIFTFINFSDYSSGTYKANLFADLLLFAVPACHFATTRLIKNDILTLVFAILYFLPALIKFIVMFSYSGSAILGCIAEVAALVMAGIYFLLNWVKKQNKF